MFSLSARRKGSGSPSKAVAQVPSASRAPAQGPRRGQPRPSRLERRPDLAPCRGRQLRHHAATPAEKYERAHEVVQIVQALWGSWGQEAWVRDVAAKRFADTSSIQPVNLQGRHVASRGPLSIPPSEQGQPVVFQAGGGEAN